MRGAAGAQVRLGVRPEEVRVRDLQRGAANCIEVSVAQLDFLGAFWRATLRLAQEPQRLLRADFSINAMRDLGIGVGQTLTVALPPESLRVFDCTPGGGS